MAKLAHMCARAPKTEFNVSGKILTACEGGIIPLNATILERTPFDQVQKATTSLLCLGRLKDDLVKETPKTNWTMRKTVTVVKKCSINNGKAIVSEIHMGNPRRALAECKIALSGSRLVKRQVLGKVAIIDFKHIEKIRNSYSLQLGIAWHQIKNGTTGIEKHNGISYTFSGTSIEKAVCIVEGGKVQSIKSTRAGTIENFQYYNFEQHFSNTLTWSDIANLEYYRTLTNSGWKVGGGSSKNPRKSFLISLPARYREWPNLSN
ncbi:MAG: hypothetical protein ABJN40_15275 [Sneathiella sp.]